jgi:3-hydroxyacyl-CoA dehydrogenase
MLNEAALLLGEHIAERPSDVDLVMVNGYGFPSQKGGPLFWASRRPPEAIAAALDNLAAASGPAFRRGDYAAVLRQLTPRFS